MRIISGQQKGRKLVGPKISKIRPTTDYTKEFLFNYLGDRVIQTKVLDLFAGTGNLGIEALSRGASEAVFVEQDKTISRIINKNLQLTQFELQSQVINSDAFKYIKWLTKRNMKFDLIFADPPYQYNLYAKLLNMIDENNILVENGLFILEHQSNEFLTMNLVTLVLKKSKKLGNTTVSFFKKSRGIN